MIKKKGYTKLVFVLVIALVITMMPIVSFGADDKVYLKGSGNGNRSEYYNWNDAHYVDVDKSKKATESENWNVWHLVCSKDIDKVSNMQIKFTNGKVFKWKKDEDKLSTNPGKKNAGWILYAPSDYIIDKGSGGQSDSYLKIDSKKNPQFNISGFCQGKTVKKGCVKLTKKDSKNDKLLLAGAKFSLTSKADSTKVFYSTDAGKGIYTWTNIPVGDYTLAEIEAPDGYDVGSFLYTKVVTVKKNETIKICATNKKINKGSLKLLKLDADDDSKKVVDAKFTLVSEDLKYSETISTGSDGTAVWDGLTYGAYILGEDYSDNGYNHYTFNIEGKAKRSDGKYFIYINSTTLNQGVKFVTATNKEVDPRGGLRLTKNAAGENGGPIEGATFTLVGSNDYIESGTTDEYGQVEWPDLLYGDYVLYEDSTVDDFDIGTFAIEGKEKRSDGGFDIVINEDTLVNDGLKLITATNDVLVKYGGFSITKTDVSGGALLSGAAFTLISVDNPSVSYDATSGTDGIASFSGVPYGDYMLYETKAADGYTLDSFTIVGRDDKDANGGYLVTIGGEDGSREWFELTATNKKSEVQGIITDIIPIQQEVLPDFEDPEGNVLGEEAKTSDAMNVSMMVFMILAALAVAGGFMAQRKENE